MKVAARDYGHDLEAMLAAITPRPASSSLPTRTIRPAPFCQAPSCLHSSRRSPRTCWWCSTEAYLEYLDDARRYDSIAWLAFSEPVDQQDLLEGLRAAGAAGWLRAGHPMVIDLLNQVRQPFNVSSIALAAAVAALGDEAFLRHSAELNRAGMAPRSWRPAQLWARDDSLFGNFVTIRVGDAAREPASARARRHRQTDWRVRPARVAACFDWPGVGERPFHRRAEVGAGLRAGSPGNRWNGSKLVICGVGLIGGSMALALHEPIWSSVSSALVARGPLQAACEAGVIDEIADGWAEALVGADFVLCGDAGRPDGCGDGGNGASSRGADGRH